MNREIGWAIVLGVLGFALMFTVTVVQNGWHSALIGWACLFGLMCCAGSAVLIVKNGDWL